MLKLILEINSSFPPNKFLTCQLRKHLRLQLSRSGGIGVRRKAFGNTLASDVVTVARDAEWRGAYMHG